MKTSRRKSKQVDAATEELASVIDSARFMFKELKPTFDDIADPVQRRAVHLIHYRLYEALQALFELKSVHDDVLLTIKMSRRGPWRGCGIRRSEYLKLVWFLHINLCYLFEEKVKLVRKTFEAVARLLPDRFDASRLGAVQKGVSSALKKHVRARGQTFHQWYQHHKLLQDYRVIELADRFDGDKKRELVTGLYRLIRQILADEIGESAAVMDLCLIHLARKEGSHLASCFKMLEKLWANCRTNPSRVQVSLSESAA
jgi:hypothetical protein